jgi:zinc/manganese transport system substrate-binding protein
MRKALLLVLLGLTVLGAASALARPRSTAGGPAIRVVAAENVWGSIAAQLGGDLVQVTNVIANPTTDPHDYEPTAVDARAFATAELAIVNGVGYDPWAPKLLAADPAGGRLTLTVGDVVGIDAGGNPHRWYSPANVQQVIGAIAADYDRLDPKDAAYFDRRRAALETKGLAAYKAEIATIRKRFAGTPVGASESIFAPLADALGLKLVTPASFLNAISEGTEPTAKDVTTIDRQIARRELKVWVLNSQNSTPDVQRLTAAARARGIAVTTITETLTPATATFQAWQVAQLRALRSALAKATGR